MLHRRKEELVKKLLRWMFEEPEMCGEASLLDDM
jgi:hypothetical protein